MPVVPAIPPVDITATPGSTAQFVVYVNDAPQPPSNIAGTVSVDFDGNVVDAPFVLRVAQDLVEPVVAVDLGGFGVSVDVAEPVQVAADEWRVTVTLTVV